MTGNTKFRKSVYFVHCAQNCSGGHLLTTDTRSIFPGEICGKNVNLTLYLLTVAKSSTHGTLSSGITLNSYEYHHSFFIQ
jgi:hypothetical protein